MKLLIIFSMFINQVPAVYNDIVTTIGRVNGAILVLLYYVLLLKPLIMIICFAYSKNVSEFMVMH